MKIRDISVPEVYKSSADFRFFLRWIELALERVRYDTENIFDLYDPLRCPEHLLWMLADTMGYKYDDRLPTAFNRLVLLYFMSMIRHKGSKDGVTLAAEVNLAQFAILMRASQGYTKADGTVVPPDDILYNRLEDTSVPANSVYVTPHTDKGYIEVVYFSEKIPTDACLEYVRPLGMYLLQHAGVRYDGRVKVSVDARLTNTNELTTSIGPTHVGHYRREDFAQMQKARFVPGEGHVEHGQPLNEHGNVVSPNYFHTRNPSYYRNSDSEGSTDRAINPGYRALYSLQLANNEQVVRANLPTIFNIGYGPQDVETYTRDDRWNLRYDRDTDIHTAVSRGVTLQEVTTIDNPSSSTDYTNPRPAVNPIMATLGDAIAIANSNGVVDNKKFTKVKADGSIETVPYTEA